MDVFLSREERDQVQGLYSKFLDNVKPDSIITYLYTKKVLSNRELQVLDAEKVPFKKNEKLYEFVLSRATYPNICSMRDALVYSDNSAHKHLAELLPNRTQLESAANQRDYNPNLPIASASEDRGEITYDIFGGSGLEKLRISHEIDSQQLMVNPASGSPVIVRSVKLDPYKRKSSESKGLCAIIANFTHGLPGYIKDVKAITDLFGNVLKYDILGGSNEINQEDYQNVTYEQFMKTMGIIQNRLNNKRSNYDRFVLFVLSHGDEYGIKTCAKGSLAEELDETGNCVRIDSNTIVNMFTHDVVPAMFDMPKCFFMQFCRGSEIIRAAGKAGGTGEPAGENRPPQTAVGADTALFYATNPGCQSYVIDQKGSWFIEETIRFMHQYHATEHVLDIMSHVINSLATKTANFKNTELYQLPRTESSLTKKFYLT